MFVYLQNIFRCPQVRFPLSPLLYGPVLISVRFPLFYGSVDVQGELVLSHWPGAAALPSHFPHSYIPPLLHTRLLNITHIYP